MELLLFTIIAIGILALPGPNVVVVASTSVSHGKLRSLLTIAGTATGMAIQLLVAAIGTTWLADRLADHFYWIKWLGLAYLVFLVIRQVRHMRAGVTPPASRFGSFQRGLWISLSNPKTILFFAAFLPQFVVSEQAYVPQILLLSLIIWALAVLRDIAYSVFADRLNVFFRKRASARGRSSDSE